MRNIFTVTFLSLDYSFHEKCTLWWYFPTIGSDIDVPQTFNTNILMTCAKSGNVELLEKIVKTEADVNLNAKDYCGWTARDIADFFDHNDFVTKLDEYTDQKLAGDTAYTVSE